MTTIGWILMILTWGTLISLLVFCYTKIMCDKDETDSGDNVKELYQDVK